VNVLIIGAGAIGSLIGGKLAVAGHRATLAGRPLFAATVREHGLIIEDVQDRYWIRNLTPAGSLDEALDQADEPFDLAVFTVKSYDTDTALEELRRAVVIHGAAMPALLSMQNGVGNEETLAAAVGPERVLAGVITTPVSVPEIGIIHVDKPRYNVGLSRWSPAGTMPLFDRWVEAMAEAGFTPTVYADAQGMKWTKLFMNMTGNATSAILDAPPEEVFAETSMVDLEIDAWREALAVMKAAGIGLQNMDGYPFRWLAGPIRVAPKALLRPVLRKQVSGARGGKMPSLHMDLHSGKDRSEVAWLNGAVVRAGMALGIPTPVNNVLTRTVLELIDDPVAGDEWRKNYARLVVEVERERAGVKRET